MNGFVATISVDNFKIMDIEPMIRHCKACNFHKQLQKTDPTSFELWQKSHERKCHRNHQGSAPAMEITGSERIFARSIAKHKLRYTKLCSDGDSN